MKGSSVIKTKPSLEGSIEDLFRLSPDDEIVKAVTDAFVGESHGVIADFRIPAADIRTEVYFDTREMLSRFTVLSLTQQRAFLEAVRATMRQDEADTIRLSVRWTKTKRRIITINRIGDGSLSVTT